MSEVLTALPAVAKSVFTECKKCGAERYHTVLAHKSETSAKVKCEICGAQKTFTLPKPGKAKKVGARTRATTAKKNSHNDEYQSLLSGSATDAVAYTMKGKFEVNQKLQHPKFGVGFIRTVFTDKIEVVFADEVKSLIHNRT